MAALTDLQHAPMLLSTLMGSDPRLLLVRAVAWLVPDTLTSHPSDPRYIDFDYDAEDEFAVGMYVCRQCFPVVYAGVIQLQWQGATERTLERYLLEGISAQLVVPLQDLDELRYGPPIDFCGVYLHLLEAEDADNPPYNRLLPIFAHFGLREGGDESADVQDVALLTGRVLIHSLNERNARVYQDLSNLLMWMFSLSGNTAVDYTTEAFWENGYDMPQWSADDLALINDINQEAHDLIDSAFNALTLLEMDTDVCRAFTRNVKAVSNAVRKTLTHKENTHARIRPIGGDPDPATFALYARWPERT